MMLIVGCEDMKKQLLPEPEPDIPRPWPDDDDDDD